MLFVVHFGNFLYLAFEKLVEPFQIFLHIVFYYEQWRIERVNARHLNRVACIRQLQCKL